MAPKNKGQQKKAVNKQNGNGTTHVGAGANGHSPSGTGPASAPVVKTNYDELQQNEMMVLQSIYFDDFVAQKVTHSAWKKAEPAFDIRIKARADEDIAVTLGVVLVATCKWKLLDSFIYALSLFPWTSCCCKHQEGPTDDIIYCLH